GARVVAGTHARPAREMAGRWKHRHVRADLGEDRLSRSALDPGDRHPALNLWGERAELLLDVGANGGDRLLEVVEVREDLAEQERMVGAEAARERLAQRRGLALKMSLRSTPLPRRG